jgi:hypothetical protein
LVPEVARGDAQTRPKTPADPAWLNAENRPKTDRIVIKVGDVQGDFKYSVTIKGVGTIDPGVRVV